MPQAAKLPGTSGFFPKKFDFLEKVLPAKLPRTSDVFKKVRFLRKKLPQAAKLPWTSGSFPQKIISVNNSTPGSEAVQDTWFLPPKS